MVRLYLTDESSGLLYSFHIHFEEFYIKSCFRPLFPISNLNNNMDYMRISGSVDCHRADGFFFNICNEGSGERE